MKKKTPQVEKTGTQQICLNCGPGAGEVRLKLTHDDHTTRTVRCKKCGRLNHKVEIDVEVLDQLAGTVGLPGVNSYSVSEPLRTAITVATAKAREALLEESKDQEKI